MKLSNQALNCIMVALQKSLMEQTDIVPMLFSFDFDKTDDGLIVKRCHDTLINALSVSMCKKYSILWERA